jgi:hypothetical protein
MVEQYLTRRDRQGREFLDNECMVAGEEALAVLAQHGLVTMEPGSTRMGEWSEAGRKFMHPMSRGAP